MEKKRQETEEILHYFFTLLVTHPQNVFFFNFQFPKDEPAPPQLTPQ